LAPQYRDNIDAIRTVPVAVPNADAKSLTTYIALSDTAEVKLENGASYIYRENSQRFVPLKYSVRERDLGSTVAQAQRHLAQTVPCALARDRLRGWACKMGYRGWSLRLACR
jgi:cobalt-zinc-cadmium resistance protein CzcA